LSPSPAGHPHAWLLLRGAALAALGLRHLPIEVGYPAGVTGRAGLVELPAQQRNVGGLVALALLGLCHGCPPRTERNLPAIYPGRTIRHLQEINNPR
jgi:hypothetical protein